MVRTGKRIFNLDLSSFVFFSILILLSVAPYLIPAYTIVSLTNIFMYIVLTVSWALFSGLTNYYSIATAAFFGIGIFISATLGEVLPFPLIILLGGLTSFILALLVGSASLRLIGMYFVIFTFGLSELIRHAVQWWEVNVSYMAGRLVISLSPLTAYYMMLIIVAVCLITAYLIRRSRYGLALRCIGEAEEAADHIGVNVYALKIVVFAISTFFMGSTGVVMATQWTYIDPNIAFDPLYSFLPILMATFGGIRRIYGQVIGATVLTLLADMLLTKFPYYYNLLYGIILIAVILFLSKGLIGLKSEFQKLLEKEALKQICHWLKEKV